MHINHHDLININNPNETNNSLSGLLAIVPIWCSRGLCGNSTQLDQLWWGTDIFTWQKSHFYHRTQCSGPPVSSPMIFSINSWSAGISRMSNGANWTSQTLSPLYFHETQKRVFWHLLYSGKKTQSIRCPRGRIYIKYQTRWMGQYFNKKRHYETTQRRKLPIFWPRIGHFALGSLINFTNLNHIYHVKKKCNASSVK